MAPVQGEEPDVETLQKLIHQGTINTKFVPLLCGSAFKNKGVQPLLDAVVAYLPSPMEVPHVKVFPAFFNCIFVDSGREGLSSPVD